MKKIVCIIFALFVLTGCSEADMSTYGVTDSELGELLATLAGLSESNAVVKNISDMQVASLYGIAPEDIEYGVVYCAGGDKADEVVLVRTINVEALKNVEVALKSRANGIINAWRYNETESIKAEKRILRSRGLYTVLVISDNTDSENVGELLLNVLSR